MKNVHTATEARDLSKPTTKWYPEKNVPVFVVNRRQAKWVEAVSTEAGHHSYDCLSVKYYESNYPDVIRVRVTQEWRRNCFATKEEAIKVCLESIAQRICVVAKQMHKAQKIKDDLNHDLVLAQTDVQSKAD